MNRIDETKEAIARIRMSIDETPSKSQVSLVSWRLGAPDRLTNSQTFAESLKLGGHTTCDFDLILRDFIAENFPGDQVTYEQQIQVSRLLKLSLLALIQSSSDPTL